MDLEEAVAILNREKHRGFRGWQPGAGGYWDSNPTIYGPEDPDDWQTSSITAFEAIAIAEKLERDHSQDLAELKKAVLLLNQSLVSGKNPLIHSDGFGNSCLCDDCMTVVRALGIAREAL
jgi:hypothetical protein